MNGCSIFAGSASTELAAAIAGELGVALSARTVEHFPDGEVSVHLDESVRGHEVFIVQSTSPPVNSARKPRRLASIQSCEPPASVVSARVGQTTPVQSPSPSGTPSFASCTWSSR